MYRYADDSRTKIHEYAVISTSIILMSLIQTFSSLCRKKKNSMEEFHSLTPAYMWTKMTHGMSMYWKTTHSVQTWISILTIVYNKKELQLTLGRAGARESEESCYPIKSTATTTTTILFCLIHRISYSKKKIIKRKWAKKLLKIARTKRAE